MLSFSTSTGTVYLFFGGFNWQTAFFAFWEQVFAVSISIGLIILFREKLNFQNGFSKMLSDNSYAAYFLQAPIFVFLALALAGLKIPLALKFLAVAPVGVAFCFAIAYVVRKIPKVKQVL